MADRPSRREFLHGSLAVAAVPLAGCVSDTGPGEPPTTPNVILCIVRRPGMGRHRLQRASVPSVPQDAEPRCHERGRTSLRPVLFGSTGVFADPRQRADRAPSLPVRDPVCQHRSHPRPGSHSRGNAEAERLHDGALREMAPGHPDQRPGGRPERRHVPGEYGRESVSSPQPVTRRRIRPLPERSIGSSGTAPRSLESRLAASLSDSSTALGACAAEIDLLRKR